jgi:hypothetical protein
VAMALHAAAENGAVEHVQRTGLLDDGRPWLATSSPSPPFEGIELAVGSCLCRFGRGTVRERLKEGREKKRRCPPLIADPEATQLARAQPAHHPAFAHLKAPSHLCRCQRPIFRHRIEPEVRSTLDVQMRNHRKCRIGILG